MRGALVASEGLDVYQSAWPTFAHDLSSFDPLQAVVTALAVTVLVCLGADYHQFLIAARRPTAAMLGAVLASVALLFVAFLPPAVVLAMQRAGALQGLVDAKQVMPFVLARVAATLGAGADMAMLATLGLAALGSGAAIVRAMRSALSAVVTSSSLALQRSFPLVALAFGAALAARGQGIIETMISVNVVYIASVAVPFVALFTRSGVSAACAEVAMLAGLVASALAYAAGWMGLLDTRIDAVSLLAGWSASLLAVAAALLRERRRSALKAPPA